MNNYSKPKLQTIIQKLKGIAHSGIEHNDTEKALEAIAACAKIEYFWNQQYYDAELEEMVGSIAKEWKKESYKSENNTVLFYDEPGFDLRALSIVYLKGLAMAGFRVVFVTRFESKDKQPVLHKALASFDIIFEYYSMKAPYRIQIGSLINLIQKYKPFSVIAHSDAYDPVWPVVFSIFKPSFERYVVNLTDHGFWLGKECIDYVLEFRDYGASVSLSQRGLPREKLIKLPYYPYIDYQVEYQGLPFDEQKKFIFTGGNLYKTISEDRLYYKMISKILKDFPDLMFLYAGSGDARLLDEMAQKFPKRVFHIKERTDLYQIMRRCEFYVNSYPVIGGLMTQYAASSGKLPLTLNHADRANGLLLHDKESNVLFTTPEELLKEARKLLSDSDYLMQRSKQIANEVLTPEQFSDGLQSALLLHKTSYVIHFHEVDVESVHVEHAYSFAPINLFRAIAQRNHKKLIPYFPILFLKRTILAAKGKL